MLPDPVGRASGDAPTGVPIDNFVGASPEARPHIDTGIRQYRIDGALAAPTIFSTAYQLPIVFPSANFAPIKPPAGEPSRIG